MLLNTFLLSSAQFMTKDFKISKPETVTPTEHCQKATPARWKCWEQDLWYVATSFLSSWLRWTSKIKPLLTRWWENSP